MVLIEKFRLEAVMKKYGYKNKGDSNGGSVK